MIRLKKEIVILLYMSLAVLPYVQPICDYEFDENSCSCMIRSYYNCRLHDFVMDSVYLSRRLPSRKCPGDRFDDVYLDSYSSNIEWCPIFLTFRDFDEDKPDMMVPSETEYTQINQFVKWLNISANNLLTTPKFREMSHLELLNISYNLLTTAQLSNINELPALTNIDLSHNKITDIQIIEGHHPYTNLQRLNLSYNSLTHIPESAFEHLRLLESLDLSNNLIDFLSFSTFDGIRKLKFLNLANNKLSVLNKSLFRFTELEVLQLQNNRIQEIAADDFDKLVNLQTLNLSSNLVRSIEKSAFWKMCNISLIDLSNNKLEVIDKELFKNVTTLTSVKLSSNIIKSLPTDLFKGNNISNFDITSNKLSGSLKKGALNGLKLVYILSLGHMHIKSIENYAFFGLDTISILLLNDNEIENLSENSFKSLKTLGHLDLSDNKIKQIDFAKDELLSLNELILSNNLLTSIDRNNFLGLNSLRLLDLSNNNISRIDSNSFVTLNSLIYFGIGSNRNIKTLEQGVFSGLSSLPKLDMSGGSLTIVKNNSFEGMLGLRNVNISHNRIEELQYNVFNDTGAINTLDLSYNKLVHFTLNNTQLTSLSTLLLNNNFIVSISDGTLFGLLSLTKLVISHNKIEHFFTNSLESQAELQILDISFNEKLIFDVRFVERLSNLKELIVADLYSNISLNGLDSSFITVLDISHSGIENVTALHLSGLKNLNNLKLYENNISALEVGMLSGLKAVKFLDLSFNTINYIQPGSFKDNVLLDTLNISHNLLTAIPYGVFHGLTSLNYLDVSYNALVDLKRERFFQLRSLSTLVADHNLISSINADDFIGTRLEILSIGGNPLPCDLVTKVKNDNLPFTVATMKIDFENENIDGITCNVNKLTEIIPTGIINSNDYDNANNILLSIREILLKTQQTLSTNKKSDNASVIVNNDFSGIENITSKVEKTITKTIADNGNRTNIILEKILKALSNRPRAVLSTIPIVKGNSTNENIVPYINDIKQSIEDDLNEKQTILNDIKKDIALLHSRLENISSNEILKQEKLIKTEDNPSITVSMFTEVCVGLILFILLIFFLYIIYKKSFIFKKRLSISTRQLPGAMDNLDL